MQMAVRGLHFYSPQGRQKDLLLSYLCLEGPCFGESCSDPHFKGSPQLGRAGFCYCLFLVWTLGRMSVSQVDMRTGVCI